MKQNVLEIINLTPESLVKLEGNPRRVVDPEGIKRLVGLIKEHGFQNPLQIYKEKKGKYSILCGNHRFDAGMEAGVELFPCIEYKGTRKAALARAVSDNKSNEWTDWDTPLLKDYFSDLDDGVFNMELTGFDQNEIDTIFQNDTEPLEGEDDAPAAPKKPKTKAGDLYQLGGHRLLCGDSRIQKSVKRLMEGQKADMVFTDPPYNVDYGNNNNPKYKNREIINDNQNPMDWDAFVRDYVKILLEFCGGNIFIAMSDKELGHLQRAFVDAGGRWSSFIIWVKNSLVISQKDYHSRHETIMYGWREGASGRFRPTDRTLDDIWEFDKPSRSDEHPTMKPVGLVEKAIINGCKPRASTLDLFGGSGSTMIACQKLKRKCFMMEIDPAYCDVIVQRFKNLFEDEQILCNGKPITW